MDKDTSKIREYYDARYTKMGNRAFRPPEAYPIFLKPLRVKPGERILDVGCGNGYLLMAAVALGLEAHGIDISAVAVNLARKNVPKATLRVGEAESLPYPDEYFDVVTCIGSLEHCLDMRKALQEMHRVTKKMGKLCLAMSNRNYLFWRVEYGQIGTEQQEVKETLLDLRGWKSLLGANGLQVLKVLQDRWLAVNTRVFATTKPWGILRRALYKLAWHLMPLGWTYQFVFICKKLPSTQQRRLASLTRAK